MYLKELKSININNKPNINPKKPEVKSSDVIILEEIKKAPDNPQYWQNTFGIKSQQQSFKGSSPISKNKLYKEKAFLLKQFELTNYNNDKQTEECIEIIDRLSQYGENAVKAYTDLMKKAFSSNKCSEKYIKLCNKIFNIKSSVNPEYINPLGNFLKKAEAFSDEDFEKFNDLLEEILKDKNTDDNTQFSWICYCMPKQLQNANPIKTFEEEYDERYQGFADYIKHFSSPNEKKLATDIELPKEEMAKASKLLNTGEINSEIICKLITNTFDENRSIDFIKKIHCYNTINDIYEDKEKCKLFNTVMTPAESRYNAARIQRLFEYPAKFTNNLIENFKNKKDKGENVFSVPGEFLQLLQCVDENNLSSFLTATKDKNTATSMVWGHKYINSYDKKFNYNVLKQADNIYNNLHKKNGIWVLHALETAQACIDEETGEISPLADDFLDFIYFDDNSFKNYFYEITGEFFSKPRTLLNLRNEISECRISYLLNSIKNKRGNFDKKNLNCIKKLLAVPCSKEHLSYWNLPELMETLKDENGIIDNNKFVMAYKVIKKENPYDKANDIIKTLCDFPEDKRKYIFETITNGNIEAQCTYNNFESIARFCFDKEGNSIPDNIKFVEELSVNADLLHLNNSVLDMCSDSEDNKNFITELVKMAAGKLSINLNHIDNIYQTFKTKDKKLPENIKEKIILFVKKDISLDKFKYIFHSAIKRDKETGELYHDEDLFNKIVEFMTAGLKKNDEPGEDISTKHYLQLIQNSLDIKSLSFKEKAEILNVLKRLSEYYTNNGNTEYEYLNQIISDINSSLNITKNFMPVKEEDKTNFISNVLSSKENNITPFESTLIKSIPNLEAMKSGLSLTYSRKDFLDDLSLICQRDENALQIIKSKTGMQPLTEGEGSSVQITGYNGIIYLDELNRNNETENLIYDCMYHFMYENKVNTGNDELDTQLNYIIKAFPEFINTIGKKQHKTHDYTLDIHQLLVTAYSLANPAYIEELRSRDRIILKISTLLHDIMKQENITDEGHQYVSSVYARNIAGKVIKNPESIDRLYEIINNHHWLNEFSNSDNKSEMAKELAFKFRRPNDFELAKIMAEADLKAVSKDFYEDHKQALASPELEYIQNNLDYLYTTGNAIFSDYIVQPSKLENHTERINGRDYKVINFHNIPDDADMGEYGFYNGTRKKDIKFLVHMADDFSLYKGLNTVKMLTSPVNGGVLSESLISADHQRTYCNRGYGVILSQENTNIINESKDNQSSGNEKDFNSIIKFLFKDSHNRTNYRKELLALLEIKPDTVSDEDYKNFYKDVLASKTSLKQISPNSIFKLGKYSITGKKLIDAINRYQDSFIDKDNDYDNNEIVGYIPKINAVIAKEKSLGNISQEVLNFAYENNYPVILI